MNIASRILSDITVYMKYAKHLPDQNRRETWEEIVDRNKAMHINRFPQLASEIEEAYQLVYEKKILPSARSLQFAGKPIELNHARIFNCAYAPIDHPDVFSEVMFLLLSGCGVGYSVQNQHIDKLPEIRKPTKTRRFLVDDSIIGWADAVKVLVRSYFTGKPSPVFDFRDIRPKGAKLITSGGKAPGPEPLRDGLHNIQKVLDRKENGERLTSIEVHDICCYIADCVLAGGIRRSAMISFFNVDDDEMVTSKFGNWYEAVPERARANNSAVLIRHRANKETFDYLWSRIRESGSGEPGIYFSNDPNTLSNPCVEASLRPFSFCNLTSINTVNLEGQEDLNARARAAAFIGTLQASYTDFHYLRDVWKVATEKDALLGVSLAGIATGPILGLDLKQAANEVLKENARVAGILGINTAARTTLQKPDGTISLVLGCSSGIHAWHSEYYLRRMRVGKNEAIYKYLAQYHPNLVEDDYFKPHKEALIVVPQAAPHGAILRTEAALDLLNRVKHIHENWVVPGHRRGVNTHSVSATVTIKPEEWDEVGEWMWKNRDSYAGLAVLPYDDHTYVQTPFTECSDFEYEERYKDLTEVNLLYINEEEDDTQVVQNLACAGGACEIL